MGRPPGVPWNLGIRRAERQCHSLSRGLNLLSRPVFNFCPARVHHAGIVKARKRLRDLHRFVMIAKERESVPARSPCARDGSRGRQ